MPGETGVTVVTTLVCSFCFACEAAGASSARHSLRPPISEGVHHPIELGQNVPRGRGRLGAFARSLGRLRLCSWSKMQMPWSGIPMPRRPGSNQTRQLDASPGPLGPHTTTPHATFFLSTQAQPSAPIPAGSRRVPGRD